MSKKTRKKSSKSSSGMPSRARSAATAKTKAGNTRRVAVAPTKKAALGTSHKARSKELKSRGEISNPRSLTEGARAPAFHLSRDGGGTVALADFAGEKLVLFFYPRANTPGCTKEAIDFTALAKAFARSGTAVLGISADPAKAQEAFRDKHQLSIPLLSDEDHATLQAYGAWGKNPCTARPSMGLFAQRF